MKGKNILTALVCAAVMLGAAGASAKMTVYDRQVALKAEIDKAEKTKELTEKEATRFRERLDDINARKEKMLSKNGNKLSYKDTTKIEKSLNSVSVDLQKKRLEKRVQ